MARIRHIALVTDDPAKTAEFYKEQFGLTELYRRPGDTGEKGVWLSDGYIYFAILKYGEPGAPKLGPGQTSEMRGIHHIGFYVDDEQATAKATQDAEAQIKSLHEKIAGLKSDIEKRQASLKTLSEAANTRKAQVQKVLEFFERPVAPKP